MVDLPLIVAAEEDSGGSFLVSPDVGLMIWTLIVFGLSMYLLAKVAFPRIAEALDRRQKAIEDSIDAAEHTRAEAGQRLGQPEALGAPRPKTGEALEKGIVADARARQEEMMEQTHRHIEAETRRAI